MLPVWRELIMQTFLVSLGEGQTADEVCALSVGYELTATCTAALLHAFVAKQVTVPRRATQEFTGAGLLKTLGDGFTCLLHGKSGKKADNIACRQVCKA